MGFNTLDYAQRLGLYRLPSSAEQDRGHATTSGCASLPTQLLHDHGYAVWQAIQGAYGIELPSLSVR